MRRGAGSAATWRAAVLLLAIATCVPAPARDLEAIVADLRGEPMTLFDWGVFMVENELQSVRRHEKDYVRVYFDPQRKRLTVDSVFVVSREELSAVNPQRACYTRHHAIKLTLGIIDTDRIHLAPAADFRFGMKFSHHNSDAFPELPDAAALGRELLEAVYIRVGITSNLADFPFDQDMRCEGPLMSQNIDYQHGLDIDAEPVTD